MDLNTIIVFYDQCNIIIIILHNVQVQVTLFSQVAAEFSTQRLGHTSLDLRAVVGVGQLMFILREHYSHPSFTFSPSSSSSSSLLPSDIRPYILLIAKQFVIRVCEQIAS